MRPDELAAEAEIKRSKSFDSNVKGAAKTALSFGVGGASAKILPFLSEFIPADLAMKGINKVFPKFGSILKKGQEAGLNIKDGLSFLRENIAPKEDNQSKSSLQAKNVIEEHAPSLHEFLADTIGKGIKPMAAAYQSVSKFKKEIKDIEKKTGQEFSDIVNSVFGGQESMQQQSQEQSQQPQQQTQKPMRAPKGGGDAALAQAFQKILNM